MEEKCNRCNHIRPVYADPYVIREACAKCGHFPPMSYHPALDEIFENGAPSGYDYQDGRGQTSMMSTAYRGSGNPEFCHNKDRLSNNKNITDDIFLSMKPSLNNATTTNNGGPGSHVQDPGQASIMNTNNGGPSNPSQQGPSSGPSHHYQDPRHATVNTNNGGPSNPFQQGPSSDPSYYYQDPRHATVNPYNGGPSTFSEPGPSGQNRHHQDSRRGTYQYNRYPFVTRNGSPSTGHRSRIMDPRRASTGIRKGKGICTGQVYGQDTGSGEGKGHGSGKGTCEGTGTGNGKGKGRARLDDICGIDGNSDTDDDNDLNEIDDNLDNLDNLSPIEANRVIMRASAKLIRNSKAHDPSQGPNPCLNPLRRSLMQRLRWLKATQPDLCIWQQERFRHVDASLGDDDDDDDDMDFDRRQRQRQLQW